MTAVTLTQLRYLVAIADAGLNITQAADRVHATQPGLSKQLKQLEEELGFKLFSRRGRALGSITPAGAEVLERARVIVNEADNIRSFAANQRREAHGSLTLITTHTQARFVLPPAIAALVQRYPGVSVHLQPVGESDIPGLLATGEADLAITSTAGEAPPAGGLALPLFRWRRRVVVPQGHPLAEQRAPDLAQLGAHPLLSYESSVRPDSSLRRAFEAAGLQPRLALTARDADLIKTYVRAGLGVGLLAEMALLREDADLISLPAPRAIPPCITWAVLPRERVLRDYTLDLLLAIAPQYDRRDVRQALEINAPHDWPEPPDWQPG
ncbi:MAG: LysR family transcriptional regulator [Lysobacteraceae bacterium]|nr:MAG: LysR family transcriptional regulator [Xanthomonadaceae bacterium]